MSDRVSQRQNKIIFGVFTNRVQLEETINRLRASGFLPSEVSVLLNDKSSVISNLEGGLRWLSGAGAVYLPNGHCFLATGPLMLALADVDLKDMYNCVAEGIISLGISQDLAIHYQHAVMKGSLLLLVHLNQYNLDKSVEYLPGE